MNDTRPRTSGLESDPSAELGLRSPVRDKEKLGDEQYNVTPPRNEVRPVSSSKDAVRCTQCSAALDPDRAYRIDGKEYAYFFCDVGCHESWQRYDPQRTESDKTPGR